MDELDDLKRLAPDERIRKLRELEQKKKKEIEHAGKLIKASEDEIDVSVEKKRKIPIDQLKSVDLGHLETAEEKDIFRIKRFRAQEAPEMPEAMTASPQETGENLEEITESGAAAYPDAEDAHRQYQISLSQQPVQDIYNQARQMYSGIGGPEEVTRDQFYQAMDISYALEAKQEAITRGEYSATEELEREANATKKMVDEIINWYKG
jgi:hypothetical protein